MKREGGMHEIMRKASTTKGRDYKIRSDVSINQ